ncbi:MAG: hypothetical protein J6P05_04970 [Lachnospiraceae bacterium]|nr:hypothetical protein [Lachnospiraceae bacterium]
MKSGLPLSTFSFFFRKPQAKSAISHPPFLNSIKVLNAATLMKGVTRIKANGFKIQKETWHTAKIAAHHASLSLIYIQKKDSY